MGLSHKDIKLLWGRSGNRCAMPDCRIQLTQDKSAVSSSFTLGEQAHIVGEKEGAARGVSPLGPEDREGYHNRILLCPTHHTEIDSNAEDWPVERLHQIKSEHELWVTETLGGTQDLFSVAEDVIIAGIIDSAVLLCHLEDWNGWSRYFLTPDPHWPEASMKEISDFRHKVISALWPDGFNELRRAASTLSYLLNQAIIKFDQHSELDRTGQYWRPVKFYKSGGFNPNYYEDVIRYEDWLEECQNLIRQAAKAANWFADVVRRDVNPMFFAEVGRFTITEGPYIDGSTSTFVLEFSQDEKKGLPDSLVETE